METISELRDRRMQTWPGSPIDAPHETWLECGRVAAQVAVPAPGCAPVPARVLAPALSLASAPAPARALGYRFRWG